MSLEFLDIVSKTKAAGVAKSQLMIRRASACSQKSQLLLKLATMPGKKDGEENSSKQKEPAPTKKNKSKGRAPKDQKPAKKTNNKVNGTSVSDAVPNKEGGSIDSPDWHEELDQENLSAFRDLFNMLDQSNTGIITAENLFAELTNIDTEVTYQDVEDLLKKVDKDGNGEIDFDEFLYHMTQMGEDLFGDIGELGSTDNEERKKKVTRRQKLFYNAITQFSIKQTLADIEKTFRIRQAPHVISHYSAGVRLIGLTTRQLERQMKKMQKTAAENDSPYAQPLQFVHMGAKVIVRRKNVKHKAAIKDEARDSGKNTAVAETQESDPMENLSQEIKDSLKFLAQSGPKGNKFPDAHLIMELRQKIGTVSAQLRSEADQTQKPTLNVTEAPVMPAPPNKPPASSTVQLKPKSAGVMPLGKRSKQGPFGMYDEVKCKSPSPSATSGKKRRGKHCATPRIEYMKVPLPSLKMKSGSHKVTFNELHEIRAKANQATDEYYSRLRQTEIRHAYEHWDRLYADLIKPKKDFRKVYRVYSPHREEEAFVICPWKPGPFVYIHNKNNGGGINKSVTSSPDVSRARTPKSFRNDHKNLIVQPIKPLE